MLGVVGVQLGLSPLGVTVHRETSVFTVLYNHIHIHVHVHVLYIHVHVHVLYIHVHVHVLYIHVHVHVCVSLLVVA